MKRDRTIDKNRLPILFYLTAFMFVVMIASAGILYGGWQVLIALNVLHVETLSLDRLLLWALIISAVLSTGVVLIFGNRMIFKSTHALSEASKRVACGDFTMKLEIPKEREIGELVENFNQMVEQLNHQQTLSSDFLAGISHEFKTPLATIRGYTQLLGEDIPREKREKYEDIIIKKVDALTALVTNILELSKLESDDIKIPRSVFPLDEQIRKNILFYEPVWSGKEIEIFPELLPVDYYGNPELVSEIWQNLLDNAIKFTPQGGKISVTMEETPDQIYVRFQDNGIGMDAETQEHMFDKFYQGSAQTGKKGSGLGLALTKRILEVCGGNIEVESTPGKGTCVSVCLHKTP